MASSGDKGLALLKQLSFPRTAGSEAERQFPSPFE